MQYLGLLFELLFLGMGIYLTLFAWGAIPFGKADAARRAEQFRRDNKTWLLIGGFLLSLLMFFNVLFSLSQLL